MPPGLSYPALRCVLENLDAMKRLHITARSHSLKRIDKRIPLNIRSMNIKEQYGRKVNLFNINITLPISFCIDNVSIVLYRQKLTFHAFRTKNQVCREVPLGSTEKYLNYYLGGGRSNVYVNKFSLGLSRLTPPAGVQNVLTINELDNRWSNFRKILPTINPDSFPLKMFTSELSDKIDLDHSIVYSSRKLVLSMNKTSTDALLLRLARLPNKDILLDCTFWKHDEIAYIIKYWIENQKTIGTKYSFLFPLYICVPTLYKLWQEFNNTSSQEVDDRSFSSFTIPINSRSKIHVHGVDQPTRLVVEVVPTTESI